MYRTTVLYGSRAGIGGLGLQAATAIAGLAARFSLTAVGPGRDHCWPLEMPLPAKVTWDCLAQLRPSWLSWHVIRRLRPGMFVFAHDRQLGQSAVQRLRAIKTDLLYTFTQVGLEAIEWAKENGIPIVLDNPNGHIRNFAEVYRTEWEKWIGGKYPGHPSERMIDRVEREYKLVDRIRVSSEWARRSMVEGGVGMNRIFVCPQPINRVRYNLPVFERNNQGPLRVCCVGSLDLRKGFVYLLRAARLIGADRIRIEFVGGTGDRGSKKLFARESAGLDVAVRPGDPVPAYHRAELFVLPSLEDGFGFVVAEAMACGLPVVVTDQCGAAEWVRSDESGWVIPAADAGALAAVLERALASRDALAQMGRAARQAVEARDPGHTIQELADQVLEFVYESRSRH